MDDAVLVRQAWEGDLAALARLLERHRPRLLAIGRQLLGNQDAAAEVTQETALVALTDLHRLRQPDLVGAWLPQRDELVHREADWGAGADIGRSIKGTHWELVVSASERIDRPPPSR